MIKVDQQYKNFFNGTIFFNNIYPSIISLSEGL